MQEENRDSALQQAGRMASDAAKKQIKRAATKKIVAVTVATSGGCLIPLIILIIILLVGGFLSAMTLEKKFNFDEIKKIAAEKGVSSQDELFNQIYDSSGKLLFTKQELNAMVFDKRSLKRMFELIYEYNTEELTRKIEVEFTGNYEVWVHDGGYVYWKLDMETYDMTQLTELEYEELSDELYEILMAGGEAPYCLYAWETGYYEEREHTTTQKITLDDTWIRKEYPVEWQIVYLLCYYDSFDNGNSSTEVEEGEKIRLKKSYIQSVIEDVATDSYLYAVDVSADVEYLRHGTGSSAHDLDSINYNWDKGILSDVSQDEIIEYGAYMTYPSFKESPWLFELGTTMEITYCGNIPVTKVKSVQTLYSVDDYNYHVSPQDTSDMVSYRYDLSKLEALLEKYGNGRNMEFFLSALRELPGGEEIADKIDVARMELEETEE